MGVYTSSDAWLLNAAILANHRGKGSTLKRLIVMGDMVNHAIFTLDEINRGLSILITNGYLAITDSKTICVQKKAKKIYTLRISMSGMIEATGKLQKALNQTDDPPLAEVTAYFSEQDMKSATNSYWKDFTEKYL